MWSRPVIKTIAAAALLGVTLGGCSDIYYDRRETISLVSGEATAANAVTQTIDPWSPASGKRDIAYNGEKAAAASERYRKGRIIQPISPTTSSAGYAQSPQSAQPASSNQSTSAPSGGSVK
jgi:hypothetical protein